MTSEEEQLLLTIASDVEELLEMADLMLDMRAVHSVGARGVLDNLRKASKEYTAYLMREEVGSSKIR